MKQPILGVIGGLGPETGCRFCLQVNDRVKQLTRRQPHIVLDNLPISQVAEKCLINGRFSSEHLELLKESVKRLNNIQADVIVITCNTVHVFIDELRDESEKPILSIIEETAKKCNEMSITKVGLLASTKTVLSGLYLNELKKFKIELTTPNKEDQEFISKCILRIINHQVRGSDSKEIIRIIETMKKEGAEGMILGCTDLPLLVPTTDVNVPIINTIKVLEDSLVNYMIKHGAAAGNRTPIRGSTVPYSNR